MKISYGKQIDILQLEKKSISLFLFANNHEERALTCFKYLNKSGQIKKAIGLCYNSVFTNRNVQENCEYVVIENHQDVKNLLDKRLSNLANDEVNLVIDYSCMTKPWYYTIILYLIQKQLKYSEINCYFVYTPSKYSEPQKPKPNTDIGPLPGKYMVPTDKPKALIVGLGYEKNKAEGIIDHLDPKIYYLFYSKPALDHNFVKMLEENNADLLSLKSDKVITYPMDDLISIERELTSLYFLLRDEYNIIIAPLGPKPFALIAMILSVKHKDIDIWRVGSGSEINEYERKPINIGKFIISKIKLSSVSV